MQGIVIFVTVGMAILVIRKRTVGRCSGVLQVLSALLNGLFVVLVYDLYGA